VHVRGDFSGSARGQLEAPDGYESGATSTARLLRGSTSIDPTSIDPTSIDPTSIHPTSIDPTSIDPTSIHPTSIHPTGIDPTSIHPTSDGAAHVERGETLHVDSRVGVERLLRSR
jgi:hypothetical protein